MRGVRGLVASRFWLGLRGMRGPASAGLIPAVALACAAPGQERAAQAPPVLFPERVNLVTVPVVVRDRQGRSVGSLKREDFQLFDRGKAQGIGQFSAEMSSKAGATVEPAGTERPASAAAKAFAPERFVAYMFDDVHAGVGDLARVRDAAWQHLQESLGERDRQRSMRLRG